MSKDAKVYLYLPLFEYQSGLEEGFIDGCLLLDTSVPNDTKSAIRFRRGFALPLGSRFPYFGGYVRGHELFSVYLGSQ